MSTSSYIVSSSSLKRQRPEPLGTPYQGRPQDDDDVWEKSCKKIRVNETDGEQCHLQNLKINLNSSTPNTTIFTDNKPTQAVEGSKFLGPITLAGKRNIHRLRNPPEKINTMFKKQREELEFLKSNFSQTKPLPAVQHKSKDLYLKSPSVNFFPIP
jgi:hypothetical protein